MPILSDWSYIFPSGFHLFAGWHLHVNDGAPCFLWTSGCMESPCCRREYCPLSCLFLCKLVFCLNSKFIYPTYFLPVIYEKREGNIKQRLKKKKKRESFVLFKSHPQVCIYINLIEFLVHQKFPCCRFFIMEPETKTVTEGERIDSFTLPDKVNHGHSIENL